MLNQNNVLWLCVRFFALSEYLSEKYDLKVEIKNFKVDCKNES